MAIPREKIVKVVKEKRASSISRGFQQGLIKAAVDRVSDKVIGPLTLKLTPKLHEFHPGLKIADPVIGSLLKFGVLQAIAEILDVSGSLLAKMPGSGMTSEEATEKTRALALWIRNYSGEVLGENAVDAAIQLVPMFKDMLGTTDISDLLSAASEVESESERHVQVEQE